MDDLAITDERLYHALHDLRQLNRWLGGYSSVWAVVKPYLECRSDRTVRVLDIGTGIADIPEFLVRRAERMDRNLQITAVDHNAATIEYARDWLTHTLRPDQQERIDLVAADVFSDLFEENSFDFCMASLFLHHLDDREAVGALRLMDRLAQDGLVVSDLHRTPLAYYGLQCINWMVPLSEMVRHDGPLSVLRGFRRNELEGMARAAGCTDYTIDWHWAFRWTLSTISA